MVTEQEVRRRRLGLPLIMLLVDAVLQSTLEKMPDITFWHVVYLDSLVTIPKELAKQWLNFLECLKLRL